MKKTAKKTKRLRPLIVRGYENLEKLNPKPGQKIILMLGNQAFNVKIEGGKYAILGYA
ncbi:hypothetical protein GYA54_03755 [Candidatus Kuenenbacteria bacterium]|nr:hypothetical protein [Candidatus Kuenenbacteria bacterium]